MATLKLPPRSSVEIQNIDPEKYYGYYAIARSPVTGKGKTVRFTVIHRDLEKAKEEAARLQEENGYGFLIFQLVSHLSSKKEAD